MKPIGRALAGVCLFAAGVGAAEFPRPPVDVCLQIDVSMKPELVMWGEMTANRIFERIGVGVRWNCGEPEAVIARIVEHSPSEFQKGALAYALPFARDGVRVIVFYDRCEPLLQADPVGAGSLLGHILAHEIGHVLKRMDGHSESGVMRSHWTRGDFAAMRGRLLEFTAEDGEFIRANLGLAGPGLAPLAGPGAGGQGPGEGRAPRGF